MTVEQAAAHRPTPGRIVLYEIGAGDLIIGQHGHALGDVLPLVVTRAHVDGSVNGHALLDGPGIEWVREIPQGKGPGTWSWPARA